MVKNSKNVVKVKRDMQKIIIKYLGPVRELEMEIKDFNLLIGEQATGKSTVAKAIYFFRIIKSTLDHLKAFVFL